LARLWRAELDRRLHPHGLSQARYVLMVLMAESTCPLTQTDLAERADITGPTLVRHLDLLEAQGLVVRTDATGDRRVKHVTLTAIGRKSLKAASEVASAMRDEMVAPFEAHEVDTAELFLQGLTSQFEKVRKTGFTDE
jgi:MarR family transcriptional regulator for hemolysin